MGRWRIAIAEPLARAEAEAFETALEPFAAAIVTEEVLDTDLWRIDAHADAEPDPAALGVALRVVAAALSRAMPEAVVEPLPERDWLAENAAGFAPVAIGRFFVHEGAEPVPPGLFGLRVAAGEAFGTGRHGSTAGCLLAITALARGGAGRCLDFGCGSGILALAMAKAFRSPVVAADNDPRAVRVARQNARLNGEAGRVRAALADGYGRRAVATGAPYDVVLCNILARPLVALARGLAGATAPGGIAVLGGFLPRDARRVLAAHRAVGFRLVRGFVVDGWQTLVLERRGGLHSEPRR